MSPITLLFFIFALVCSMFASPIKATNMDKHVTHTGRGTWFDVGLSACGETNVNSDKIIAISSDIYGSGGNCGQYMYISNTVNGKSVYAMVHYECPGCSANNIDMFL